MLFRSELEVDYNKQHARSQLCSAAPPPASVAAAMAALKIVETEPERRKQIWENTAYMKRELDLPGYDPGDSESPRSEKFRARVLKLE